MVDSVFQVELPFQLPEIPSSRLWKQVAATNELADVALNVNTENMGGGEEE
jgi:hypothetical protein